MKRLLSRFFVVLTTIIGVGYLYVAARVTDAPAARIALALPFLLVWIVPVVYWIYERESATRFDEALHAASYVSMGWLNFVILLQLVRDAGQALAAVSGAMTIHAALATSGGAAVLIGAGIALAIGMVAARRGPYVRRVTVPIAALDPRLEGFRIAQISDLHVGPTIGEHYVRRVVATANALDADLVALTGDFVDGPVARLARHVAPLAGLRPAERVFFVLGNHDCYAGAAAWVAHFRSLNVRVLLNEHVSLLHRGAPVLVGGVLDPAIRLFDPTLRPRPDLAAGDPSLPALRVLLAHHPGLASLAAEAGFDLQLSGHTHAGQFYPWTLAVRLVHAPHFHGLSRCGHLSVYVNGGTGTWGPPVRLGTKPELTLLTLVAA